MSLLIINTMDEKNRAAQEAIKCLTSKEPLNQVIHTRKMKINPCIGCNACWLKTPGICSMKDDYEQILRAYLQYDTTIFISDTSLDFISYQTKNVIDRMLPLVTMYTHVKNGQMRHVPRYEKKYRFGLIYSGVADEPYMEFWLERFALNFDGISIGAFPIERSKEAALCI